MQSIDLTDSRLLAMVLDSANAGVYVTDAERRIVYWNRAAHRITGWRADDILGRRCLDQVLCHVDKDGRQLCGEEFCPLHRAITTGTPSDVPMIVFARTASGGRVPMRVSVAPLCDEDGQVVGGVETFQDMSTELGDFQRAQRIQAQCLLNEAEGDPRLKVSVHYAPHDVVGGDFCAISHPAPDRYAFIVADVMGHGISAALYTMYLRSLWDGQRGQETPDAILEAMNRRLGGVMSGPGSFATAVCGVLELGTGRLKLSSAGGPDPLVFHPDGSQDIPDMSGVPLGCIEDGDYDLIDLPLEPGDRILLFSDGLVEIDRGDSEMLGTEGLVELLRELRYPQRDLDFLALERQLLTCSDRIRFADDLTIVEMCLESGDCYAD